MYYQFEESDSLNTPVEFKYFDTAIENFPIHPHWHYFMEFIYLLEGNAQIRADNDVYFLSEGDLILFHPKVIHAIYATENRALRFAIIKFDINRLNTSMEYAPKLRSIFHYAKKKGMNIFFSSEKAEKLNAESIVHDCMEESYSQNYGYDFIVRSRIIELLTKILRNWQECGFIIDNAAFSEDNQNDISNITEYIEKHVGEGIKVSDIASICNMSYSNFNKNFTQIYGKTCKEYIEEIRITKAEQFLLFTNFDLTYISHETGFSDCSHMIKSFKQLKGITPKQFRTQHHIRN